MDFQITTPSLTPLIVGGIIALVLLGGAMWFLVMLVRLNRIRFLVSDHALEIVSPAYGRTIAKTKLKLDEARVVKQSEDPQLRLEGKKRGLGLPGCKLGFYRIASAEQALVFLGRGETVLYVPTTEGYPLILETPEAQALLDALKA